MLNPLDIGTVLIASKATRVREYASTDFVSTSTSKRSVSILEGILACAYSHFTQTVLVLATLYSHHLFHE